jgi:hypothetical protein
LWFVGKVYERQEEKTKLHDDESIETEWDEVLANATEEDLVDLAGEWVMRLNFGKTILLCEL